MTAKENDPQPVEHLTDGLLRGTHRLAKFEPDRTWPAEIVQHLAEELIVRRGRDRAWLVLHPEAVRTDG